MVDEKDIKEIKKVPSEKKETNKNESSASESPEFSKEVKPLSEKENLPIENNESGEVKSKKPQDKKVDELKDLSTKSEEKKVEPSKDLSKKNDKLKTKVLTVNDSKELQQKAKEKNNSSNEQIKNKKNTSYSASSNEKDDQNEYVEKLVSINRVAKVVKGGRRFSFAALVVVGDGNGMVGHGKGKAKEVPEAIKKATEVAKNNMIRVPLRQGRTLHHDIHGRFDSGKVYLRSAPSGTGVIAGGPMRAVFEALGIQDIVAKSVGTSNPHNMVRATFQALQLASSPKIIATRRGLKVNDITKRRKNILGTENVKN